LHSRNQSAQRKRGGTQGGKRELRVLNNEFWLEVQEKFIQDQQDIDKVTEEAFFGSRDLSQVFKGVQEVKVKPKY